MKTSMRWVLLGVLVIAALATTLMHRADATACTRCGCTRTGARGGVGGGGVGGGAVFSRAHHGGAPCRVDPD